MHLAAFIAEIRKIKDRVVVSNPIPTGLGVIIVSIVAILLALCWDVT
jgi:hypothetical protein